MKIFNAPVTRNEEIGDGLFVVSFESGELARSVKPGQFVNIRMERGISPLLRRPFSISRVDGDHLEVVFQVIGLGTQSLARKRNGDLLDVLGPLGVPFRFHDGFETAVLVAGGLGVAPFPFLTQELGSKIRVETFLGARTAGHIADRHLRSVHVATDDGSKGYHGTVVALLEGYLREHPVPKPKIFACGPTPMLKAVTEYAIRTHIACELSLEGDMACGIGICQGCPVERVNGEKKYSLVCTDGPTFDCREVNLA